MKIGIVVVKPMHFDAPFFRFVTASSTDEISVIYTDPSNLRDDFFDREVGARLSWGVDLFSGYRHVVIPERAAWRWLTRHLRASRYDLLIVPGYRTRGVRLALAAATIAKAPVALRLDSVSFNNTSTVKLAIKRGLFLVLRGLCDHFFAVSGSTVALLRQLGVPQEQITKYPYTVDLDWFRGQLQVARDSRSVTRDRYRLPGDPARVILSVAKFNSRESPWDLLDAFAGMKDRRVCLWLIGDGPDRPALEAKARDCGADRVVFSGYVPFQALPAVYAASDVFVHAARSEPWGVSVEEALACELPVVASSRVGSALDLIVDGRNGYIYSAGDSSALRRRLESVLFDSDLGEMQRESGRVPSEYTYPAIWRNVVRVAEAVGGTR